MRRVFRILTTSAGALLISACSFQSALDKMVPPARQAEIVAIAERFCTDPPSTVSLLHPEIAQTVVEAAAVLPRECPDGPATWQLANYSWKANATNGSSERQEEVVIVGAAKGKWTTVSLRFYAENGAPLQITEWNVVGSATRPEALVMIDQYEAGVKALRIAGPILLVAIGGLVFWLVQRHRAKKRATADPF